MDFFTGNRDGKYAAGADGTWRLTLPELFRSEGGNYAAGWDLQSVVMKNIKDNWIQLGMGVILIPVAAKTVSKLIRKPVILPVNRILKSINLDVKV